MNETFQRALFSVADKTDSHLLAQAAFDKGYQLVASGGTASYIRSHGLPVREVKDITNFPEILGGRVKTLHPVIHGGILARHTEKHLLDLQQHGILPIDLVVVNLYPFQETVRRPEATLPEAVEQIDIGGVALLRAAAKNFESVTVVCDPADYPAVMTHLRQEEVPLAERKRLALKAFRYTAAYDAAIANYLAAQVGESIMPEGIRLAANKLQALRYGENPHQQAALYLLDGMTPAFEQLHGKEMSYNNWRDLDGAWNAVLDFQRPTVVISKHANPCGIASAERLIDAYQAALSSDPVSAFGSVIAMNRPVDLTTAEAMKGLFIEVLVAPDYEPDALARLKRKSKNLRLLRATGAPRPDLLLRSSAAGLLAMTPDRTLEPPTAWKIVTKRAPTAAELAGLDFAWRVVKHIKSNAIVMTQGEATVGVGAGQMSRVDAVKLAALKAGKRSQGALLASDAFFPFPDGVEEAARAGVTAIVQPGGSKRDGEVIAATDRLGLAMAFTSVRHFLH